MRYLLLLSLLLAFLVGCTPASRSGGSADTTPLAEAAPRTGELDVFGKLHFHGIEKEATLRLAVPVEPGANTSVLGAGGGTRRDGENWLRRSYWYSVRVRSVVGGTVNLHVTLNAERTGAGLEPSKFEIDEDVACTIQPKLSMIDLGHATLELRATWVEPLR